MKNKPTVIEKGKKNEVKFSGSRIKRGLYKSKNNLVINADVNGSYNIMRKVNPEIEYGKGAISVSPMKVRFH